MIKSQYQAGYREKSHYRRDFVYTSIGTSMVDKVLMRRDRKKSDKIENLDSRNLPGLPVVYLAPKNRLS